MNFILSCFGHSKIIKLANKNTWTSIPTYVIIQYEYFQINYNTFGGNFD